MQKIIYSIIFNTLYSIADYGEAFALSYFGKSPLILDKLIKLAICIAITHLVMLVAEKVASYIDNINNQKTQGKTTTMNILSGLYPLENGELLVDNQLKNDCRMDLVFVSQEVELFDLSIRDNLCLGKDIPDEKIMQQTL